MLLNIKWMKYIQGFLLLLTKKLTHFSPVLYFVSFNQLFSLLSKTNDWFLYQMGQRAEMDQTSS